MIRGSFWMAPGALAVLPLAVLHTAGARSDVAVITGMLPPERPLEALGLGLAYVAAHLVGVTLGPPLLVTGAMMWVHSTSSATTPREVENLSRIPGGRA